MSVLYTQEMKKSVSFWGSLEKYFWKVKGRSPLPRYWRWVGVGLVVVVVVASALNSKNSTVGARGVEEVVARAAKLGDYQLAQKLWNDSMSEFEDLVYPERRIERRIAELEAKLEEYPGNRQIYLGLTDLYEQLGNRDKSDEYREKARILSPNN